MWHTDGCNSWELMISFLFFAVAMHYKLCWQNTSIKQLSFIWSAGLAILLPFLISRNKHWKGCKLRIFTAGSSRNIDQAKLRYLLYVCLGCCLHAQWWYCNVPRPTKHFRCYTYTCRMNEIIEFMSQEFEMRYISHTVECHTHVLFLYIRYCYVRAHCLVLICK